MRKRDAGILVLCCIGLLVSFQHEGALSIRRGFVVHQIDDASKARALAPPIITDLDGDGKNEVLLLTSRETLALVNPALLRHSHFDFTELLPKAEVAFTTNCIGFAAGYLEKHNSTKAKLRKQVVVAVLEDYSVIAYNERLEMVWHDRLPDTDSGDFAPAHASVLVLPYTVQKGDHGMVVVGVDTRRGGGGDPEARGDVGPVHFSYYALNGMDGTVRWKHDASSFVEPDTGKKFPKQNYKLNAEHIERHTGEQDWTVFRRSMMAVFPHTHVHTHHTRLRIHHFSKKLPAKEVEKRRKQKDIGAHHAAKKGPGRGDDNYGELGARLAGLTGAMKEKFQAPHQRGDHPHPPNVLVAHLAEGIEVLHLYTGRTLCHFGPLHPGHVYDDVDGDTTVDAIHVRIQRPHLARRELPFALDTDGPVCAGSVDSGAPGTVRENLWNGTICTSRGSMRHFEVLKDLLRQGQGEHPGEEEEADDFLQFWGGQSHLDETTRAATPLVLHHRIQEGKGLGRLRSTVVFYISSGLLTCVDPSRKRILWQAETDSTFAAHDDVEGPIETVQSADRLSLRGARSHERTHWTHFPHTILFSATPSHAVLPSSKVKTLRSVATMKDKPYVLVVGDNVLTAVRSETGLIEEEIDLDEAVIAPLVLGDFNSDGTTDIIAISPGAYYGFLTHKQGGTPVLTFLLLSVIGLLGLLFASLRLLALSDPYFEPTFSTKRSTD